jgi:hypothetical protein
MNPATNPSQPTPNDQPTRPRRVGRVLAVAAGVAMVPALYAGASAATSGGGGSATLRAGRPGDDNGVDAPGDVKGDDGGVAAPVPPVSQSFSSFGGSITVSVTDGALSLTSSSPSAGFSAEVHDNGPTRVEVRFFDGQTEWRIRIELGSGGLTSEITQHG